MLFVSIILIILRLNDFLVVESNLCKNLREKIEYQEITNKKSAQMNSTRQFCSRRRFLEK